MFVTNTGGTAPRAFTRQRRIPKDKLRSHGGLISFGNGNDPSAGSPTETLLRLLLPLNDQVCSSSQPQTVLPRNGADPETSLNHSIGSSDGRCVQRAGT